MKWSATILRLTSLVVAASAQSPTNTVEMVESVEGGGLYFKGGDKTKISAGVTNMVPLYVPTKLRSLKVTGRILDGISEVTIMQEFQTPEFFPDNFETNTAVYQLPMDELAAVTEFRAEVDGRVIKAEVKERKEARKTYDDAVAAGQQAYLAEQVRADIFNISVGNIPKNKIVRITLVYVTTLETLSGNTVRFVLPTAVALRYSPFGNSGGIPVGLDMINDGVQIGLDISMAVSIDTITSGTHNIQVDKSSDGNKHAATVRVTDENPTDRDVVILIKTISEYQPQIYVESSSKYGTTAIMLSIVPNIDIADGSYEAIKQEYIFVLDRSGSMSGTKMEQTKKAMLLIVENLPDDSIFNIVGFGDSFEALFEEGSRQISVDSAKSSALAYINSMDADFGGTEILAPLRSVLGPSQLPTYERLVFVITDGQVSNTDQTLEYVRSRQSAGRVFSLGIGAHVSALLVRGIARAGRGTAAFVDGESGSAIESAVQRQMEVAIVPALSDVNIEWGQQKGQQAPFYAPPLLSGKRFMAYYLLPGGQDSVVPETVRISSKVFASDAVVKYEVTSSSFLLMSNGSEVEEESDLIHKIACRSLIRDLEEGGSELHEAKASDEEIRKEIVRLGLKYQIASSETSFVAVVVDENSGDGSDTVGKTASDMAGGRQYRGRSSSSSSSWVPRHLFWILELSCVAIFSFFLY